MISVYAVSKKTLEDISYVYHKIYKMNFIGMRFFTVYGPYGRPDMSIFKFFNSISKTKKSRFTIMVNTHDHLHTYRIL